MDITYRRGTLQDTPAIFNVFTQCFNDLSRRSGTADHDNVWADPTFVAAIWDRLQSQFEYLATTAEQYWVAEQDGHVVGYARSILENGVRELTEFFVWPACQSAGIGRELLLHAFPVEGAQRRVIMATTQGLRITFVLLSSGQFGGLSTYNCRPIQHVNVSAEYFS